VHIQGGRGLPLHHHTFCDNLGTISFTKDTSFHARSKHIDVAHHFIRERVEMNQVTFKHLPTHLMPADTLTKSTAGRKQARFCELMGIYSKENGTY
jgi:hypothetical protein